MRKHIQLETPVYGHLFSRIKGTLSKNCGTIVQPKLANRLQDNLWLQLRAVRDLEINIKETIEIYDHIDDSNFKI